MIVEAIVCASICMPTPVRQPAPSFERSQALIELGIALTEVEFRAALVRLKGPQMPDRYDYLRAELFRCQQLADNAGVSRDHCFRLVMP